ncbi:MAG: EscU/YscU/HrcU family type III secretion system export apparatus switch protein, partial [Clostridia bacterium]|nr:EscU/YscU/HrcU family type III secretion system export apparatus switch protein [Clostridia bacterium]
MPGGDDGEKTEKATPKKRQDAREKGQVKKSQEVVTACMLLGLFAIVRVLGPWMVERIQRIMEMYLSGSSFVTLDVNGFTTVFMTVILNFLIIMSPILGGAFVIAVVSNYAQIGWLFSTKALEPKFDKMNPISGLKRMVSLESLYNMLKSVFKLIIIFIVAVVRIKKHLGLILRTMTMGMMESINPIFSAIIDVCFYISG